MQEEMEPQPAAAPPAPGLSARAIQALAATRSWARFAGIALFGAALLEGVRTGLIIYHLGDHFGSQAFGPDRRAGLVGGLIAGALITIAIYTALGWYALRYAERLNSVRPPRRPTPAEIVATLGAQHRYWRLQGILTAAGLGLIALIILLAIVAFFAVLILAH